MKHLHLQLNGFLQGVGFRPFVYRLASQYQQKGWVANTSSGISLHIEGTPDLQQKFLAEFKANLPPFAQIKSLTSKSLPLESFPQFTIKASQFDGQASLFVLPDIATCPECVAELFDSTSRYYQYPLISCCQCGPRYSIMQQQPYDRARTTMVDYSLCAACQQAFSSPENRRFHAQTIACSDCGPMLQWMDAQGQELATKEIALAGCIEQLQAGKIVAVKGIGGYQLLVNAQDEVAVARLRRKKMRLAKPFALLATDLAMVQSLCEVNKQEQQALQSAMAPIVLLKKHANISQYQAVAPNSHLLAVMLPNSGLQHLIMQAFGQPLIATSANRAGEPICIADQQALATLAGIADYYLMHGRVIQRALDDSIVRVIANKPRVLRRARGYAPFPIALSVGSNMLALGGHLKSSWALSYQGYVLLSQYLGDLHSLASQEHFKQSLIDAQDFYAVSAKQLIHDQHPDYFTSHYARQSDLPSMAVQHHHAHAFSCMAEHQLKPPVLAITWDGTGLGEDYRSWGGEFFLIQAKSIQRFAHIKPLLLVGGDKANQEPRRVAIAILYQLLGEQWQAEARHLGCVQAFTANQVQLLAMALENKLNTPQSSSMGRLFDAVASLLNLCQINGYEGQAASCLEAVASLSSTTEIYACPFISGQQPIIIDWQEMFQQILADLPVLSAALIAAKFHNTLADIILRIAQQAGEKQVVLSGGCFQNATLTEKVHQVLEGAGFQVYSHEQVPSNDAGLALGQLYYTHCYNNE
ncbi:MAG: carbamoyltransferase HypF [Methyloprofundus sp.]|nr:carbamoyltransferase HypF [Methyloprofundus sp.]